jgi:hypothetical protein
MSARVGAAPAAAGEPAFGVLDLNRVGATKGDGSTITAWKLRHRVRFHHKYLSQIITHALKEGFRSA